MRKRTEGKCRTLVVFIRRWANLCLLVVSLVALAACTSYKPLGPGAAPASSGIVSSTLSHSMSQDGGKVSWAVSSPPSSVTGLSTQSNAAWGVYTSPVFQSDFPFNAVGLAWKADTPPGTQIVVEVHASSDGQQWSQWFEAFVADGVSIQEGQYHSQLIVARGSNLQYRATLYANEPSLPPSLGEVKITYIDSTKGPTVTKSQGVAPGVRPTGASMPPIVSRAAWGSPEPNSSVGWPPSYKEWKKIALHDTLTVNDDPDPASTMRAIWYYHAKSLGWGDIGYNYLIDPYGNIYEGRFGGENVTGGHVLGCYNPGSIGIALLGDFRYTDVSPAMQSALVDLLAAKTFQHNIDPLGSGDFGGYDQYDRGAYWHLWLPNIFAHRDVSRSCGNTHSDPGDYAYNRIPQFRADAWNRYQPYGEEWVSNNTPQRMLAGSPAPVAVTAKNTGRNSWVSTSNFRLGYRWYAQNGAEVLQAGGGNQRAPLPFDVAMGQTVTINAQIIAPADPGTYTLQWDMVQDGVTWFVDQGLSPLNVTVVVAAPTYIASFVGQSGLVRFFSGDKGDAWFDLRNTGTATWTRAGQNPVRLGTANPQDRSSAVATAGAWPNPSRAATLNRDTVAPGEIGRFTFQATAPLQPGVYREHFMLVSEGKTWFGPDVYLDFVVLPSIKTFVPELLRDYTGAW